MTARAGPRKTGNKPEVSIGRPGVRGQQWGPAASPAHPPRLLAGSPWWTAYRPSADGAGVIVGAAPGRCRARSDAVTGKSFRRGAGL